MEFDDKDLQETLCNVMKDLQELIDIQIFPPVPSELIYEDYDWIEENDGPNHANDNNFITIV